MFVNWEIIDIVLDLFFIFRERLQLKYTLNGSTINRKMFYWETNLDFLKIRVDMEFKIDVSNLPYEKPIVHARVYWSDTEVELK